MNNRKNNRYSIEEIKSNPYSFTFQEAADAMGGEAAAWYASLYRKRPQKENQTLAMKIISRRGSTEKYTFALSDGECIETSLIRRIDGGILCVSTQAGCPAGCIFCESGKYGFSRNLSVSEIIQQVVLMKRSVSRIAFMGMGEPLLNYDNLIKAIHILQEANGLNYPAEGITVVTTGPVGQLERLRDEDLNIRLVISLHAASQAARDIIMPNMYKHDINQIVEAALSYSERSNRKVVFSYLLLPKINDSLSDVDQLARWFRGRNVMINLLEYNETGSDPIKKPDFRTMAEFKRKLEYEGLEVKVNADYNPHVNDRFP